MADRFYNELFAAIKIFIRNNPRKLDLYLYKVKSMSRAWLKDIYVRAVSVNDCPDMKISFTVIVEADMGAREYDYHYDEIEECGQWFSVECSGDLACDLNDFTVHSEMYIMVRSFSRCHCLMSWCLIFLRMNMKRLHWTF